MEKFLETLKKAHGLKSPLYAWSLEGESLIKADLSFDSYRLDKKEISFCASKEMLPLLNSLMTSLGKLHFYFPKHSLAFSAEVKKFEDTGLLTVHFPTDYLFHDRRENERFEILSLSFTAKFSIKDKIYQKTCFDIGRGGFSLLFSQGEKFPFKENDILEKVELKFGDKTMVLKAQAIGALKLKPFMIESIPYAGARYSLRFVDVPKKDLLLLENMIKGLS